jgi:hypothetical protein
MKRILLAMLAIGLSALPALAVISGPIEWTGYVRSNFQVGNSGQDGEALWTGFGFHPRLQETQYYESYLTAHLPENSKVTLMVAQGGPSYYYSNTWGQEIALRELNFSMEKVGGVEGLSAWFGDRTYRGDYFNLFDSWPFDNQNMLGGGMRWEGPVVVELALGAKKDMAYTGEHLEDNMNSQRFILINKLEWKLDANQGLKSNLEFHRLSPTEATVTGTGPGPGPQITVPGATGFRAGLEHILKIGAGTNYTMVSYATGDVTSADVFETPLLPVAEVSLTGGGTMALADCNSRKGSTAFFAGLGGEQDFEAFYFYYAMTFYNQKNSDLDYNAQQVALSIRPMIYLTPKLNAGLEVDGAQFNEGHGVNWAQVAPMVEYTLNGRLGGGPKFKAILANAFYKDEVIRYGKPTKYALNGSVGMELCW